MAAAQVADDALAGISEQLIPSVLQGMLAW